MSYILNNLDGSVLLVGGYGVGNIGDEAILSGLLGSASPNIDMLTVVTHNVEGTRRLHAEEVPANTRFRPIEPSSGQLLKELKSNDSFVFGGGGLFSRYMGPYAAKIPYYALAAKSLNKSLHWAALGVYPSTPDWTQSVLSRTMNWSETVTVRDPTSQNHLKKTGVTDVTLVDDPATRLTPDEDAGKELLEDQDIQLDEPLVGIAARRVLNENTNKGLQQAYLKTARELDERGINLAFFPFCRHSYEPVGMDHEVCNQLADQVQNAKTVTYEHPKEALDIVAAMDGLVATRLHSMIFAHVSETPFVAIEYADKVSSLLDHYGEEKRGVDLETVTANTLLDRLDKLVL